MTRQVKDIYFWLPRITGILVILFISMFALDAFDGNQGFSEKLIGFLIHLVPSYILIAFLFIAWKWELSGGIIIILFGLLLFPWHFQRMYVFHHSFLPTFWISLTVIGPIILWGLLFLLAFYKHRNKQSKIFKN